MTDQQISLNNPVPNFTITATNNTQGNLTDFLQGPLVLYFYPKDNTPICTQESKHFAEALSEFQACGGTTIFGVSRDSLASHEKFKTKLQLPFELISDKDETLCHLFDVLKDKSMFGKKYQGIERSTFLINKDGTLIAQWRKVKLKNHISDVLAAVKALST